MLAAVYRVERGGHVGPVTKYLSKNKLAKLHNVEKWLKMSHLNFWHFRIFDQLKVTYLVTLLDRKLQVFKNFSKFDHFWHF